MAQAGASIAFVDLDDYEAVAEVPHDPSGGTFRRQVALLSTVEDLVRQRYFGTGDMVESPTGQHYVRVLDTWQALGEDAEARGGLRPFSVGLGEIMICCTVLERSRDFYVEALCCTVLSEKPFATKLGVGDRHIWLVQNARSEAPSLDPLLAHVTIEFVVSDYRAAVAHLESCGATIVGRSGKDGACVVLDPDGNAIELAQARL
jgi:catechol 2,3-dioxygenase-like lactoylglutathione lyase family enzyme